MIGKKIHSPEVLALATSQASRFADELVHEPIAVLELRIQSDSSTAQQTRAVYATGRDQALGRGRGGFSFVRGSKTEMDSNVGSGESSARLLARRLR
jgi:hypothetical protein